MEYYSAIKRKPCHLQLKSIMLSEMSDRWKQILYNLIYVWNIEKPKQTHKEIRFAVTRGHVCVCVAGGGGQKVNTSSYKDK